MIDSHEHSLLSPLYFNRATTFLTVSKLFFMTPYRYFCGATVEEAVTTAFRVKYNHQLVLVSIQTYHSVKLTELMLAGTD